MKKTRLKVVGLVAVACVLLTAGVGARVWGDRTNNQTSPTESTSIEAANSVHIEKEELPFYKNKAGRYIAKDKKYKNAWLEWHGMFVYQGRLYKQSTFIDVVDKKAVGAHLGTATGDIGDDVEFSGNVVGEVYSVNGVDPSFMLYVKLENGATITYINDNDLTLTTGADLYGNLLHLKGNVAGVRYQKSNSWSKLTCLVGAIHGYSEGDGEDIIEAVNTFVDELYESPFMYTVICPFKINNKTGNAKGLEIWHLDIITKAGVEFNLRLIEGGYVNFTGIDSVCVKVDEAKFNELLEQLHEAG